MKKIIGIIYLILIFQVACQTINKEKNNLKKIDNQEEISKRHVKKDILISNHLPEVKIKVNKEFKYLGRFDFEIIASSDEWPKEFIGKSIAAGERFVFAKTSSDKKIEKLFIVQFEGFLADNDFTYNYNFAKADSIGNNRYRHNTWFYDSKQMAEQNPQNENAKTREFLQGKGFYSEDEVMMSRFLGLASEDRRNEIIIFYFEMLKTTTGYSLAEWEDSVSKDKATLIEKDFIERPRQSFTILE